MDHGIHSGGFPSKQSAEDFYENRPEEEIMATLAAYAAQRDEDLDHEPKRAQKVEIKSVHSKRQNYILFFGCKPGESIPSDSRMIKTITSTLLSKYDRITFSLLFPQILSDI